MRPGNGWERGDGDWFPPVADSQRSHGAKGLRGLRIGARDDDALAHDAGPQEGHQDDHGYQALSGNLRDLHDARIAFQPPDFSHFIIRELATQAV